MNTDLQHRLYNTEATPPSQVWEKIAAALDESYLNEDFTNKLKNAEVAPPASAWEAIAGELESQQFPTRLYNLEVLPPAKVWERIAAALGVADKVPVRRLSPIFRYAAAAMVIGLLALGGYRFFSDKSSNLVAEDNASINNSSATLQGKIVQPENPAIANADSIAKAEQEDAIALENSKQTYAHFDGMAKLRENVSKRLTLSTPNRIRPISDELFTIAPDPIITTANFNPSNTYQDLECNDVNAPVFASGSSSIDMASRYVMLMTPDGHMIRISRKLGDMVCCVSGAEQDQECIDQMKSWRKKIANSPITPSPGNFMDILDLVHSVNL